jgi:drug/metabolite transporter (DMT)-like permease
MDLKHTVPGRALAYSLLLLSAVIWGFAFLFQRTAMTQMPPLTFNGLRFFIAGIILSVVANFLAKDFQDLKTVKTSLLLGALLFLGSASQQLGITTTSAGKSAFLTGLYIIIVPIIVHFLDRGTVSIMNWLGALLAVVGLYLLALNEQLTILSGDLWLISCAIIFAFHVVYTEHAVRSHTAISLGAMQCLTCGTFSLLLGYIIETPAIEAIHKIWIELFYTAVLSAAIAYTLQLYAQRGVAASNAALILSLEAVFAAVGGYIFLEERFTIRQLAGCILMFVAIIISQIKIKPLKFYCCNKP